jgi:hypothetical protein
MIMLVLAAVVAYHAIVLAMLIAAVSSPVPANVNRASRAGPQALHDQSGAFDHDAAVRGSTGRSGPPCAESPPTLARRPSRRLSAEMPKRLAS